MWQLEYISISTLDKINQKIKLEPLMIQYTSLISLLKQIKH